MFVSGTRPTFILLTLFVCAVAVNASAVTKKKHAKPALKQEQPAPAPIAPPPTVELTLEQMPAVAPQVTYQNRQLTIIADNSSLGDILRAVKSQTGASVDLPSNANARVVAHLGPGPSRDVLATLLNGTLFNYVLLGTVNDPSAVGKIILTQKPTGAGGDSAVNAQPMQQQNAYPMANAQGQVGDEQENESEVPEATEDQQQQPVDQGDQAAPSGGAAANGQQPNLRTPEQLLQELQRQQMLQQQMQQQQQQGNPPTGQVPEQNTPQQN